MTASSITTFTYWMITDHGRSKMYDTLEPVDEKAIADAKQLSEKYDGKWPVRRVDRSTTRTIWKNPDIRRKRK